MLRLRASSCGRRAAPLYQIYDSAITNRDNPLKFRELPSAVESRGAPLIDMIEGLRAALADRYHVERELGRGGMATVYLARDLRHARLVALKLLRPDLASALGPERFLREVQITAGLSHPHILTLFDSGIVPSVDGAGIPYYAMAYVEGESLRARLEREQQMGLDDALRIAREVAEALGYAHQLGIVHRDIKPENILLSNGRAVVADFGIARALDVAGGDRLTGTGLALGTPSYMSPEQAADSRRLDGRSDIYSLGCMLYEMLAGQPPFTGPTAQSILARHSIDPVPSLRTVRPTVPHAVDRAIAKALAKVPADRWSTAAEFADALEASSLGRTDGARSWPFGDRMVRRGILGFAALGVAALGYMALRGNGSGSTESLLARGVLRERERVLVADFDVRGTDTLLSGVVTTAFRIDLSQSPSVTLVSPTQVAEVLARMRRPITGRLDAALAREIAVRDGIKGVVVGEVASAGRQYLLSAQLLSAGTGEVLAARRETARDSTELIRAVDRLSETLREKIGESLKRLRSDPPLERVTTPSLAALRRYAGAMRAGDREGDLDKAIVLLEEAIALDSGFAMAYRSLAIYLSNRGGEFDRMMEAYRQALARQDRLTERERYLTRADYRAELYDHQEAIAAYRSLLDAYPGDLEPMNNLAAQYSIMGDFARAEPLFQRAMALDSSFWPSYANLVEAQVGLAKFAEAKLTLRLGKARYPDSPYLDVVATQLDASNDDYRSAEAHARALVNRHGAAWRATGGDLLGQLATVQGRLAEADGHWRSTMSANAGDAAAHLANAVDLAFLDVWFRNAPARGLEQIEKSLAGHVLDSLKPLDRPYTSLAFLYAAAGRPRLARTMLSEYERVVAQPERRPGEAGRRRAWGYVALAEGRVDDAIGEFRQAQWAACPACSLPDLARAYDRAGQLDSAMAVYQRYVTTPDLIRLRHDVLHLAGAYRRLGELHHVRGNREEATRFFTSFTELWQHCDPELKPQVAPARAALARLKAPRHQ